MPMKQLIVKIHVDGIMVKSLMILLVSVPKQKHIMTGVVIGRVIDV